MFNVCLDQQRKPLSSFNRSGKAEDAVHSQDEVQHDQRFVTSRAYHRVLLAGNKSSEASH